ncbi:MAG: hypothetical protein QOJ03_2066, partial [Frankiaceae bacterium]|nr:hypothetical protein [Frankiaceae bacterium]
PPFIESVTPRTRSINRTLGGQWLAKNLLGRGCSARNPARGQGFCVHSTSRRSEYASEALTCGGVNRSTAPPSSRRAGVRRLARQTPGARPERSSRRHRPTRVVAVVCAAYAAIERRDFPSLLALLAPASSSTTPICPAAGPSPALVLVEVLTLLEAPTRGR